MSTSNCPTPIFDQAVFLEQGIPDHLLTEAVPIQANLRHDDFEIAKTFLLAYQDSPDTFNAYRREVERLCQWAWFVAKKSVKALDREAIVTYINFAASPPHDWIATQSQARFIDDNGLRKPNPLWRPFLVRANKPDFKAGHTIPSKKTYQMSAATIRALFAGISTFYTFLQQEQLIVHHPVQAIRQKNRFFQKKQTRRVARTLSTKQWQTILSSIQALAETDSFYERHLFVLSLFFLLGLRISELVPTHRHTPVMSDFFKDQYGLWWFITIGKGNKEREIAVPDAMLTALARYRSHLKTATALPVRSDKSPLLPKIKGHGSIGLRQLRHVVQHCFDLAVEKLRREAAHEEADELSAATVHWLRHTAISADVKHRPREHVRDDAGHENIAITDLYIDIERQARHQSAKYKRLTNTDE